MSLAALRSCATHLQWYIFDSFFFPFLQIFAACRAFWTRRPVRAWMWPCREWTGTSVKSSPTSSPPWGLRSSIGTETHCVEPSCCSAPTERTRSSSRSVLHSVYWLQHMFTWRECFCVCAQWTDGCARGKMPANVCTLHVCTHKEQAICMCGTKFCI